MTTHIVHGISRVGRFIREEIKNAQNSSDAMRQVRAMHPDAQALACRAPKHAQAVLDLLAARKSSADRIGVKP